MNKPPNTDRETEIEKYNKLLLDIGSTLMACGAYCGRVESNVRRFADVLGVDTEIFFSFNGLMVSTRDPERFTTATTHYKRVSSHLVNFEVLTAISILSWDVSAKSYSYDQIRTSFDHIKQQSPYKRWEILLGVGFACAALCLIMAGNWQDAVFAFVAAVAGMYARQIAGRQKFNPIITFTLAAFLSSLIASLDIIFHVGLSPEKALASSVLYLVPGVHLVNAVIEIIEGHIPTAVSRGIYGAVILMCMAVGMSLSILLIGLNNF